MPASGNVRMLGAFPFTVPLGQSVLFSDVFASLPPVTDDAAFFFLVMWVDSFDPLDLVRIDHPDTPVAVTSGAFELIPGTFPDEALGVFRRQDLSLLSFSAPNATADVTVQVGFPGVIEGDWVLSTI